MGKKKGKSTPYIIRGTFALILLSTAFAKVACLKKARLTLQLRAVITMFFTPALYPLKPLVNSLRYASTGQVLQEVLPSHYLCRRKRPKNIT
jgi:hypothetical protein